MWRLLRATYGGRTWRRLLYVLLSGLLAMVCLAGTLVLLVGLVGIPLALVGVPVLAGVLCAAQGLSALHRRLARELLGVTVPAPGRHHPRRGPFAWLRATLTDPTGWRAVLYMVAKVPLGLATSLAIVLLWTAGAFGVGFPFWYATASGEDLNPDAFLSILLATGGGIVLLLATPWLTRALLWPDVLLIRALLGPSRAVELRRTRTLAVDDAADRLRSIERDLHDGAQAQLVTLAMTLGLAKEELAAGDTAMATTLIEVAHDDAKQALVELRDLARGIHPPVLDGGLEPALRTLATRSAVPVELRIDLRDRPAAAIETIAYFTAAELLTNVAKHSVAQHVILTLTRPWPGRLRLSVHDDGVGGAVPHGGLVGIAERIGTVDGRLDIYSPLGGPTIVTVEIPDHS